VPERQPAPEHAPRATRTLARRPRAGVSRSVPGARCTPDPDARPRVGALHARAGRAGAAITLAALRASRPPVPQFKQPYPTRTEVRDLRVLVHRRAGRSGAPMRQDHLQGPGRCGGRCMSRAKAIAPGRGSSLAWGDLCRGVLLLAYSRSSIS